MGTQTLIRERPRSNNTSQHETHRPRRERRAHDGAQRQHTPSHANSALNQQSLHENDNMVLKPVKGDQDRSHLGSNNAQNQSKMSAHTTGAGHQGSHMPSMAHIADLSAIGSMAGSGSYEGAQNASGIMALDP